MLKIIFSSPSWIQEFFQRRRTEQVELDELEKLLHGHPDAAEEFLVRRQQVHRQGRVDLNQYRVFRVADKGLYAQILFDFLEEKLDLPAVFIDVGNGFWREPEVIG